MSKNSQKFSTSGLGRLVDSFDTFWMPEIDPGHLFC